MEIEVILSPKSKIYLARWACNNIFGNDTEMREKMSEEVAIKRFDTVWNDYLIKAIAEAEISDSSDAEKLISSKRDMSNWFDSKQEHRIVRLNGCIFVAQLLPISVANYKLTELWYVRTTNPDPRTIFVTFDTQEEKDTFDFIASREHFRTGDELAKQLLVDYLRNYQSK